VARRVFWSAPDPPRVDEVPRSGDGTRPSAGVAIVRRSIDVRRVGRGVMSAAPPSCQQESRRCCTAAWASVLMEPCPLLLVVGSHPRCVRGEVGGCARRPPVMGGVPCALHAHGAVACAHALLDSLLASLEWCACCGGRDGVSRAGRALALASCVSGVVAGCARGRRDVCTVPEDFESTLVLTLLRARVVPLVRLVWHLIHLCSPETCVRVSTVYSVSVYSLLRGTAA
jgi:hypothetical protein